MSFGNASKAKSNAAKGAAYAQPKSFYSPFGNFLVGQETSRFEPASSGARAQYDTADNKLTGLLGSVPTSLGVNDYFNNPYYESTLQQMRRPIDYQYGIDRKNMTDDLNARNLMGGSYSALQEDLLRRRYDQQYANAADQARQTSANAYQQSFANQMSALAGLRADQTQNMQNIFYPMTMANQANSAMSGLQQAQAGIYGNLAATYASKKSPLESFLDFAPSAVTSLYGKNGVLG